MDKIELLTSTPSFEKHIVTPTDDISPEPIMEVKVGPSWVETPEDVFRSWTGERRINGDPYHGPIYGLASDTLYTGARTCACSTCQSHVEPRLRKN
jgi:hypothetical protein